VYYLPTINQPQGFKIFLSAPATGDIYGVAFEWLPENFFEIFIKGKEDREKEM
jgi:hypothetical protein